VVLVLEAAVEAVLVGLERELSYLLHREPLTQLQLVLVAQEHRKDQALFLVMHPRLLLLLAVVLAALVMLLAALVVLAVAVEQRVQLMLVELATLQTHLQKAVMAHPPHPVKVIMVVVRLALLPPMVVAVEAVLVRLGLMEVEVVGVLAVAAQFHLFQDRL